MSDLMVSNGVPPAVLDQLPPVLRKAFTAYQSIRTYEDVERFLLKGNGYSPNTLRSYLTSFRQFTEYVGAPTVFDVHASDIERWFDQLAEGDHKTAALRIAGVRAVYRSLEGLIPGSSPFNDLPERLEKKLSSKHQKRLTALDKTELRDILRWSAGRGTPGALMDHGILYFLATSGLRANEAAGLKWKDIEFIDNTYYAVGIGKGGKPFEQELYQGAIEAVRAAFRQQMGRKPQDDDSLFLTLQGAPMPYHTMWRRMKDMGAAARADGILKRDLVFSPHLMRRTFATVLHGAGMAVRAVQQQTRHSNVATLEKHYLKNKEASSPYFDVVLAGV